MGVNLRDLFPQHPLPPGWLDGKRVAVDGHNVAYRYLTSFRGRDGDLLRAPDGRAIGHLIGYANLVRHLRERPTVMKRFVNGIMEEPIWQKRVPKNIPDWLQTATVAFPSGRTAEELVANDEETCEGHGILRTPLGHSRVRVAPSPWELELMGGPQSSAQRYYFFAERAANKIPDIPQDTPLIDIRTAGVLGAGVAGPAIGLAPR